jgi:hypothetical protein
MTADDDDRAHAGIHLCTFLAWSQGSDLIAAGIVAYPKHPRLHHRPEAAHQPEG